jgi:hypothetical protein
LNLSPL